MNDLISRQWVIDALDKHLQKTDVPVSYPGIISALTEWLNELPSAQPETHDKRTETHACDLIDRQAAIDALGGNEPVGDPSKMDDDDVVKMWERIRIMNIINKLPSAQPETHDKRTETHACDLIDRQAAIDEIEERKNANGYRNVAVISELNRLEGYIMRLPSAQSERQKGEWIDYTEDGYVECPFCHSATNCDGNKDELHFCFSCGADMRGEQDG